MTSQANNHALLLISWMRWYTRVILILGVFFLMIFAIRQSPASLVIALSMLLVFLPTAVFGSFQAKRGHANPAIFSIAFVCWSLSLLVAGRGIVALPATLPVAMLPLIIALPYISNRGLLGIALTTLLVCIVASVMTLFDPVLPSSLNAETLGIIMVPVISLALGLAVFGLWHVGSLLRNVNADAESVNRTLTISERLLEQKVLDRTADLQSALAEISDIENIATTVNVTLDLDEVIAAMRNALQRVFKFDNISIFLLDNDRNSLIVDRVAGLELDPESQGNVLESGLSLTDEHNVVVASFINNKSLLVPDISTEQITQMSPSDRSLLDINPVKSVLMCPLSIEDKTIGVVSFGRLHETMHLEADEIDRILRYVTPLATVIRNARLFDETREARAAAIQSSQAKSRFLANMSHELRTPLNAIIGYSEMLLEDAEDEGHRQYLDDLQKIHGSGMYLLELISSVLDLTKIEAGKLELSLARFDVQELIDEVALHTKPLVEKNANQLILQDNVNLGVMYSDATKIRQVLVNLLSNAAKFSEKGTVGIGATRESKPGGDRIYFTVTDTGIGLTDDQIDHIFDAFTQVDESASRKYGGSGLGLTISREYCEMLGGEISVQSEPGKGSTFIVSLPADMPASGA